MVFKILIQRYIVLIEKYPSVSSPWSMSIGHFYRLHFESLLGEMSVHKQRTCQNYQMDKNTWRMTGGEEKVDAG